MAIIKIHNIVMEWENIDALKDYLILNNIKYEDIDIISYSK